MAQHFHLNVSICWAGWMQQLKQWCWAKNAVFQSQAYPEVAVRLQQTHQRLCALALLVWELNKTVVFSSWVSEKPNVFIELKIRTLSTRPKSMCSPLLLERIFLILAWLLESREKIYTFKVRVEYNVSWRCFLPIDFLRIFQHSSHEFICLAGM